MNEQWINDTCMMFDKAFNDIDMNTVRNILTLALADCEITKYSKAVTIYHGESNETVLKSFLVSKKVEGKSTSTAKHYGFIMDQFFRKTGKLWDEVNANDIRIYFAKRELEDGVSPVTRNNERSVLSSFYQWLTDEELIPKNPVRKVPKIKEPKVHKKAFTQMELEKIRANCTNETEAAVIEILISTGCRVSELCGIRLEDINDDTVTVHGKGSKDRTCYLTAKAQMAIQEYMQSEYYRKRKAYGSEYLFMRKQFQNNECLKPMDKSTIENMTRRIGKNAGVNNCHPHRFRRTCATMALERGMPIERVSHMLGHESIETTQIYLDLTENGMHEAHRKYVC